MIRRVVPLCVFVAVAATDSVFAWDLPGHMIVTELAVERLPDRIPAWVRDAESRERLAYLSGEPDRWRGLKSRILDHHNGPDHYLDVEDLADYGLALDRLPRFRGEFIVLLATERARRPDQFPRIDRRRDRDYIRYVPGLLPYAIEENYAKIASCWSTLRTFEAFSDVATPGEIAAARQNVLYSMGILSHFVGDAAQPLHLTRHHNGWVGENPRGYTTSDKFHSFTDGGVLALHDIRFAALRPRLGEAVSVDPADPRPSIIVLLAESFARVEPLYALEKSGDLKRAPGKRFIEDRLLAAGSHLAGFWTAAFDAAGMDDFLSRRLRARRRATAIKPPAEAAPVREPGSEVQKP